MSLTRKLAGDPALAGSGSSEVRQRVGSAPAAGFASPNFLSLSGGSPTQAAFEDQIHVGDPRPMADKCLPVRNGIQERKADVL